MLLVFAWSGLSSAAEQNANSNHCNISETDAAGLNGDLSVDIHALHNFMDTAARMLKEEKFVELDCLADHEVGIEEQRRLERPSWLAVGVGGRRVPAAVYLSSAGVGRVGVAQSVLD